jgi:hypothetical protein
MWSYFIKIYSLFVVFFWYFAPETMKYDMDSHRHPQELEGPRAIVSKNILILFVNRQFLAEWFVEISGDATVTISSPASLRLLAMAVGPQTHVCACFQCQWRQIQTEKRWSRDRPPTKSCIGKRRQASVAGDGRASEYELGFRRVCDC